MSITAAQQKLLNHATPGLFKAGLGDILQAHETALGAATATKLGTVLKGAAVVNATDNATAITQLNALLASLRAAGVIA
jgi:hypothetical protein